jgi:hypothetical protein
MDTKFAILKVNDLSETDEGGQATPNLMASVGVSLN